MNIDFKNFHKIECSDSCTTLQHPGGHTIKIAHKGLSPSVKKELDEVPMKMAKGGYAKYAQKFDPNMKGSKGSKPADSTNTMPGSTPMAKNNYTEPQDQGPDVVLAALNREAPPFGAMGTNEKQHYPPCINPSCKSFGKSHPNCRCYGGGHEERHFSDGGSVESFCSADRPHQKGCEYYAEGTPDEPVQPQEQLEPQSQDVEAQPETASEVPNVEDPYAHIAPITDSASALNHMAQESQKFQSDIDAGHIKPETYHTLFADKSLPGKIGTIFGLMLSGAGSGLAGQNNALLGMMDNQIKNDLQAQESSAKNKQSFMSINGQNLVNLANSGRVGAETQEMKIAMAKDQANYAIYNTLAQNANNLPPGPTKQAAFQQLVLMRDAMEKDKASAFAKAAGAYGAAQMMGGAGGGGQGMNTAFMKSGMAGPGIAELGQDIEEKTIPGVASINGQKASRPIPQEARNQVQAMEQLDAKGKDLLNYVKQHTGTWNPQTRAVATQKIEEMKNFYNESIKGGALTEGRLGWYDEQFKKHPTDILPQIMGSTSKLKEMVNSNSNRRDILLKQLGFTPKGGSSDHPHEGTVFVNKKTGARGTIENGKWKPLQ